MTVNNSPFINCVVVSLHLWTVAPRAAYALFLREFIAGTNLFVWFEVSVCLHRGQGFSGLMHSRISDDLALYPSSQGHFGGGWEKT